MVVVGVVSGPWGDQDMNPDQTTVVVVAGNALVRDGIRALLERERDLQLVGDAPDVSGALGLEDLQVGLQRQFLYGRGLELQIPAFRAVRLGDDGRNLERR